MACSSCETLFQSMQSVVVTIVNSGGNALIYVQNQGRNIVHLRRIVVCYTTAAGGTGSFYLRPPPSGISWSGPEYLEPGSTNLYYSFAAPSGSTVQAQAEYVEIEARSRSCTQRF